MYTILLVIHTILVLFLIVIVLLQRSDSDGMGGLGGGGGNQFMTGRAQANLLTRTTAMLAGAFMVTSIILAIMANRMTDTSIVDSIAAPVQQEAPISEPAKTEAPVTPTVPKPE
ncbi:MAG: preprotein translocase subunit SecG [Rickettsiales bacterium]|jgi:preprotein translocase subunit SecG|nr:preprotein translocase subunit SecG [Rickettsiales bacterium]